MKKKVYVAAVMVALVLATSAVADQKGNNGNPHNKAESSQSKCPPGLAKKNNGCQPPGLAKKGDDYDTQKVYSPYTRGDRLPDDYVVLLDPRTSPLGWDSLFVRTGDYLYLLDRKTGNILNLLGPIRDWDWTWEDTDFTNCPPGLAKKNPPCVPPGQAKQGAISKDPYAIGAHLPNGYHVVIDPRQYDPHDDIIYTRRGDTIYRVERENGQVIDLIGTIADILK